MNDLDDFRSGWDFMSEVIGADLADRSAASDFAENAAQNEAIHLQNDRAREINAAIDDMRDNINALHKHHLNPEQLKGFAAEEWHASTFNIDAIRNGSGHQAWTLNDNGYASVDIDTNFGKQYGLKYYNSAKDAENAQAALDVDTRMPKYHEQERLIAHEQLEEAKKWAHKRELKNAENRPDVALAHNETHEHLVGKISDGEGIESRELSIKEAKQIAREANKEEFDPQKHGYAKESILEDVQIDYVNRAINAGLTAAAITAISQLVPEMYKAIDYLIKNGEIDVDGIKRSGEKVISSSGEAFLRGSIAYSVEMAIQEGMLGQAFVQVSPSVVGAAVTIILGKVRDSIKVASGKITAKEMGAKFADSIVASAGYLTGVKIGGAIVQALFPELPGISYAIGSLLGCSISVVYNIGKKQLISFCVDTGFTCFGLVEQNYELPEEALEKMGVHYIPIPRAEVHRAEVSRTPTEAHIGAADYETIDITVIRRGVIGVNRVGYMLT